MWFLSLALANPPASGELLAPAIDVDRLRWLEGCWSATVDGTVQQECWSPARGGLMLGTHVDAPVSGEAFFEFLRITGEGQDLSYVAQPRGGAPVVFRLKSIGPKRVEFTNPMHDFPKTIRYALDGDALTATVAAGAKQQTWTWTRAPRSRR